MMKIVWEILLTVSVLTAIFALFGGIPGQDVLIDAKDLVFGGHTNNNDGQYRTSSNSNGDFEFPTTGDMVLRKESYLNSNFGTVKGDTAYELVIDEEAGIPDQQWYENVWDLAQQYDENADDKGVKRNEFIRDAMDNRKVAYWQETAADKSNSDYDNGRKVVIVFINSDGDIVAMKLGRSITTMNFDDAKPISDIFKEIEPTIPVSQVVAQQKSWQDQMNNWINTTFAPKEPESVENKTQTITVAEQLPQKPQDQQKVVYEQVKPQGLTSTPNSINMPISRSAGRTQGISSSASSATSTSSGSNPTPTGSGINMPKRRS